MHVHASNEFLSVSKYVNLTILFYLINISLENEIFDDFNKVVDIIIKNHQLLRRVMITRHWGLLRKLVFEKDKYY